MNTTVSATNKIAIKWYKNLILLKALIKLQEKSNRLVLKSRTYKAAIEIVK